MPAPPAHDINKFKLLNLLDNINQLVVSFLTEREQFTKIGEHRPATIIMTRSTVQSSGVWPTLFVIFVIDQRPIGFTNRITKYADDTSLLLFENTDIDITEKFWLNLKWAEVSEWNINKSKTKELLFYRSSPRNCIAPAERMVLIELRVSSCLVHGCRTIWVPANIAITFSKSVVSD